MKRLFYTTVLLLGYAASFAQSPGLINNGANIYLTGGATIYVSGSSGNYTNQNGGQITAGSSDSMKIGGNWSNTASNVVFTNNGGIVSFLGSNPNIGGTNSTSFNT